MLEHRFVHENVVYEPLVADVVKASFDVALQYPLGRKAAAKCCEYIFTGILGAAPFAEAKRLRVCCCLRHRIEGQGIERLHGPVIHTGNTQRAFLFLARFLDIHPAERFCLVAFTCSEQDNAELYDKVKGILVDSFFHQPVPGKVTDIP